MSDQAAIATATINTDEIHLWNLLASNDQQATVSWLGPDELARYQGFSVPLQAGRYLVFRCAMRQILGAYLGIAPQEVSFAIQEGGKPFIAIPDCDLQFNLAHTGDVGMLAISSGMAVGIDIEQIRSMNSRHRIARRIFSSDEIRLLAELTEDKQDEYFYQLWTSMEARQKCRGKGIFGDKISSRSVGIHQFSPLPRYLAAVAWDQPSVKPALQFFDWPAIRKTMPY